nr:RecName: Full=Venom peptide Ocy3 [Opisthacanthus cayaporum]
DNLKKRRRCADDD